jgi:hypothetical protein
MRASWGAVPNWVSEPSFLPEVDELIEPDTEAKATALDFFRRRWNVHRERNGLAADHRNSVRLFPRT